MTFFRPSWQAALDAAPGPSPWYLRAKGAGLDSARGRLRWRDSDGTDAPLVGKMVLTAPDGTALLVVGMYARVVPLGGSQFAVWRQAERHQAKFLANAAPIQLEVYDADALWPIEHLPDACRELEENGRAVWTRATPVARLFVPVTEPAGTHALTMPRELAALAEIFLIADASSPGAIGGPDVRILVLRPSAHEYEVIPQDWWNESDADFGYQWITRVTRDPKSGRLVGDGIRIDPFRLDATGRRRES